jgi:hypothetical protein
MKRLMRSKVGIVDGKMQNISTLLFRHGFNHTLEYFCSLSVFSSLTIL